MANFNRFYRISKSDIINKSGPEVSPVGCRSCAVDILLS